MMKHLFLATLRIVSICAVMQSCNGSVVPPVVSSDVIMPLHVNNVWEYEVTLFDADGNRIDSFLDSLHIVEERQIADEKWFVDDEGVLQMNRHDGRWIFSGNPYLAEKHPAMLNDRYSLPDSVTTVHVIGTHEGVQVPFGTFSAYVYRRTYEGELTADLYFAPNTGLIRLDRYSRFAGRVYLSETHVLRSAKLQ